MAVSLASVPLFVKNDLVRSSPGVTEATVNLAMERASVRGAADLQALIATIASAGYTARPIEASATGDEETAERKDAERRDLKRDFTIAAALALPVFLLEMGSHVIPGAHELIGRTIGIQTSWYIQFVLTTLVLCGLMQDRGRTLGRGDVAIATDHDDHRPRIVGDETCICLVVMTGEMRFTGRLSRVLNYLS